MDSTRVIVRRFPTLLGVALATLPIAVLGRLAFNIETETPTYHGVIAPLLSDTAATIAGVIAEASLVTVVLHHLWGRPVLPRDVLAWLPSAGTVILGGLLIASPAFIARAVYYAMAVQFPESPWAVALSYCTCVIAYLIVLTFWMTYVQVVVAERVGFRAAFVRSAQLGRGQRWRIFALLLILLAINMMASFGLVIAGLSDVEAYYGAYEIYTMIAVVICATMYHHLRLREEGMDSARAVTAFE